MKRRVLILAITLLISVLTVTSLILLSDHFRRQPGNFLRLFPPHPATMYKSLNIVYNSYYIAGISKTRIYLGNYTAPLHVLSLTHALTDSQHVKLKVKNIKNEKFWSLTVRVDSPSFYLMDGTRPIIYKGIISDWTADSIVNDHAYFVDALPLSNVSFVFRSLSRVNQEYELGKKTAYSADVQFMPNLLQKQIDGKFCVDGMMDYDSQSGTLVYLYFYRNQYIVMDSSLNLRFRANTIDTVTTAQIQVAKIRSTNTFTMSSPPLIVNRRGSVFHNYLFVNSALMASNENKTEFENLSVIDVYDLADREYRFSFYLAHASNRKLHDFRVFGDQLFALIDTELVVYNLSPTYFAITPSGKNHNSEEYKETACMTGGHGRHLL
jgi:hypothetical protein